MGLATALRKVAGTLIDQFGEGKIVLRRVEKGIYDPATDDEPVITNIDTEVDAVTEAFEAREVGIFVQARDIKFLVASEDIPDPAPDSTWLVVWNRVTYEIVRVKVIRLQGQAITYQIHARGPE